MLLSKPASCDLNMRISRVTRNAKLAVFLVIIVNVMILIMLTSSETIRCSFHPSERNKPQFKEKIEKSADVVQILSGSENTYEEETIELNTESYGEGFCVAFNMTKAKNSFRQDGLEPISLAVHSTSHFVREIEDQCASWNWNGPISLALYVDSFSYEYVQYMYDLHRCSTKVQEKMNIHIVYKKAPFQEDCSPIRIDSSNISCTEFMAKRTKRIGQMVNSFGIYPINVMRNVARKGAASDIHMLADAEMFFSQGFAYKMKKLANDYINGKDKNVLVIRRFEAKTKADFPKDYNDLFDKFKGQQVFEFHHKFFPLGHTIEGLWFWFRETRNNAKTPIAWPIPYKSSSWEAQLIQHRNDPYNPEYFPSRIRDQQTLVYEHCRANYTFLLASHGFNIHKGIKTSESNLAAAVVTHQKKLRYRSHVRFNQYLNETYPDTFDQCGRFIM